MSNNIFTQLLEGPIYILDTNSPGIEPVLNLIHKLK